MNNQLSGRVIYEDNHLIAINKLSGELSQGDSTGEKPLGDYVKEYLKVKYNKPGNVFLGVIHRLDQPVSGVILFAKTSKALSRMNELLKKKQVQKTYLAFVEGVPKIASDELKHYLYRLENKNITKATLNERENSKLAILKYHIFKKKGPDTILLVEPLTGRQHQIRAQLSAIGCPIKHDIKYGAKSPNLQKSIYLHSYQIEFIHPIKKENLIITAPEPDWIN